MKMNQRFVRIALTGALLVFRAGAEETAVVKEQDVNVRGQPSLTGEVITQRAVVGSRTLPRAFQRGWRRGLGPPPCHPGLRAEEERSRVEPSKPG